MGGGGEGSGCVCAVAECKKGKENKKNQHLRL